MTDRDFDENIPNKMCKKICERVEILIRSIYREILKQLQDPNTMHKLKQLRPKHSANSYQCVVQV